MLRATLLSPSWWISTAISTLLIMCFIVMWKKLTVNVPIINTVTQAV